MIQPATQAKKPTSELRRTLGVRDLTLFYISTTFGVRWIATAAAAGPSALIIWVVAAAGLFVPLVFAIMELSGRYPEEGGIYVWTKRAFGPFAGFMTGWMYWTCNLPYYPGLLYFGAANIVYAGGPSWQPLSTNGTYFIVVSLVGLAIAVWLNVIGLNVSKWLSNAGAIALWIATALLIALGAASWSRFGSATSLTIRTIMPSTALKDVIFWSTIAFAYAGFEAASTMGDEIENPRRTVPRALLVGSVLLTALYIAGTFAVLVAVPSDQVSGLQGFMQAIDAIARRVGFAWLIPPVAALVTLSALAGVGGWFASNARVPFVAGVDKFLPAAFGRLHPRWHTPYVSLLAQAILAAVFVVLGQAGTNVRGAYEVLVSTGIATFFLPYLLMFAALIAVQREPAPAGTICVPGGPVVARLAGAVGFATTAISIVLACVPPEHDPNPLITVLKIVGASAALVALGVVVYLLGRRRALEELS